MRSWFWLEVTTIGAAGASVVENGFDPEAHPARSVTGRMHKSRVERCLSATESPEFR
jgi:hypothetical protein